MKRLFVTTSIAQWDCSRSCWCPCRMHGPERDAHQLHHPE